MRSIDEVADSTVEDFSYFDYEGLSRKGDEDLFERKLAEGYTHVAISPGGPWVERTRDFEDRVTASFAFSAPDQPDKAIATYDFRKFRHEPNWESVPAGEGSPREHQLSPKGFEAYADDAYLRFGEPKSLEEVAQKAKLVFEEMREAKKLGRGVSRDKSRGESHPEIFYNVSAWGFPTDAKNDPKYIEGIVTAIAGNIQKSMGVFSVIARVEGEPELQKRFLETTERLLEQAEQPGSPESRLQEGYARFYAGLRGRQWKGEGSPVDHQIRGVPSLAEIKAHYDNLDAERGEEDE